MASTVTLEDLEASYHAAQASYVNRDPGYQEAIRGITLEELISDTEEVFADEDEGFREWFAKQSIMQLYIKAKVFKIARDEGIQAALLWKLSFGGAA